jgi:hypothetical protein
VHPALAPASLNLRAVKLIAKLLERRVQRRCLVIQRRQPDQDIECLSIENQLNLHRPQLLVWPKSRITSQSLSAYLSIAATLSTHHPSVLLSSFGWQVLTVSGCMVKCKGNKALGCDLSTERQRYRLYEPRRSLELSMLIRFREESVCAMQRVSLS